MQKVTYNGKTYRSVQQACISLGITRQSVTRYTQKGMSVEQAIELAQKNKKRFICTDHLGNEFKSMVDMAEFHHIPYSALFNRLNHKWSLEKALTTHSRKYNCTDHLGNEFESKRVMAEFYNIPYRMLISRLEIGWDIKKALTTPIGKSKENMQVTYKGKKYRSTSMACDFLGISPVTVCAKYKGIPVEQAFDKILENKRKYNCTDHLGNGFESKRAMAKFYNIPYDTLLFRLKSHWDLERALTTPKKNKRKNRQCKNY